MSYNALAYLDINVWVKGWLAQPNLVILLDNPPGSTKTVAYRLLDVNGTPVTDEATTSISPDETRKAINLGDYLDAQHRIGRFVIPGVYYVLAKIVEDNRVFLLPIITSFTAISYPWTGRENLDHFMIIDRVSGFMMKMPNTLQVIPVDDRYMVFAYYHYAGKGRLVAFDKYGVIFDTGYHKYVKLQLRLRYNSIDEMIRDMLQKSWGLTENVVTQVLNEIKNENYENALKILRPFYMFPWIGRIVSADFDISNKEIILTSYTYLGQWDWGKIFAGASIGCVTGIAIATIATIATAGIGAVTWGMVGVSCGIGGVAGASIVILTSSSSGGSPQVIPEAEKDLEKGLQQNQEYYNQAINILQQWRDQGKITQEDFNQMKTILDNWKVTMDTALQELFEDVKEAYNAGLEDSKKWIIASGVGGFALGLLIGKR